MANKQAFQFWHEKESRDGGVGASATTPRLPCGPRKRLPELPPGSIRTQGGGVVASLKLKWEQVPERGKHDIEPSKSQTILGKPKKSSMPSNWSLLDCALENRSSTCLKSHASKSTAKESSTDQLCGLTKASKLSPAPKGACGRSCYGHAPLTAQVILFVILEPHTFPSRS